MQTSDFYYELPRELIAQVPIEDRAASRLLVYDRKRQSVTDTVFSAISKYLRPGDVLVRNTTKVIPARLFATREDTGGAMEFLLLKRLRGDVWECLARPAKRARAGQKYRVSGELSVTVLDDSPADGGRIVELGYDGVFEEILDRAGQMPLPPYITERLQDKDRYQTVYARERGSAAAPTAGLHFTNALLDELRASGVAIADILLHVGLGTFRPVSAKSIEEHHMHSEYYEVTEEAAELINGARAAGGRIVAVGTTSCRTLESVADENGVVRAKKGWTDIFISPGYRFRAMDALITNFHLPESTLLMLVSAFATREEMLGVYRHAVEERYRFFSFGDAMLIV